MNRFKQLMNDERVMLVVVAAIIVAAVGVPLSPMF